jgi:hypothetical protein
MFRRSLVTLFLFVLVIGLNVLPASTQTPGPQDLRSVPVYYSATDLLQTYKLLNSPLDQKRELFGKATARGKSNLWRLHLALAIARRPALQPGQQQVILEAISLATPELFEISRSDASWQQVVDEPLQRLRSHALEVFSKEQAAEILAQVPAQSEKYLQDDVVESYASLDSLPMGERKSLVSRVSAQRKSDLWRLHLSLALIRTPNLRHDQQAVILSAIALAAPAFFDLRDKDPDWKSKIEGPLKVLQVSALIVFSKDEASKIFATLGSPIVPSPTLTTASVVVKTSSSPTPECSCSMSSDYCYTVCGGNLACTHSENGCGTLWQSACDGRCFVYNLD